MDRADVLARGFLSYRTMSSSVRIEPSGLLGAAVAMLVGAAMLSLFVLGNERYTRLEIRRYYNRSWVKRMHRAVIAAAVAGGVVCLLLAGLIILERSH